MIETVVAPPSDADVVAAQTAAAQRALLEAFRQVGNVTLACEVASVGRRTHYDWIGNDEVYAAAFLEAQDEAADRLEAEARRRAVEGLRRYKFQKDGTPIAHPECYGFADPKTPKDGLGNELAVTLPFRPYYEHEYSDTLLIFLLKGARPDKYAERHKVGGNGKNGGVLLETIVGAANAPKADA